MLSSAQKRALFAPLLRTVARYPGVRIRIALGRRGSGGFDLDEVRLPDSRLTRDAQELARQSPSPYLLHHSYRVYLFGLALARLDAVEVDEELAFVASTLHDLNLEHPTAGQCFAVVGAHRAKSSRWNEMCHPSGHDVSAPRSAATSRWADTKTWPTRVDSSAPAPCAT
ncbi:MAG TPA: hypothetical protein VFE65_01030 [Pseudonocardia sp.]|nr:hypothetical protein [Pseudonocardia sp.]